MGRSGGQQPSRGPQATADECRCRLPAQLWVRRALHAVHVMPCCRTLSASLHLRSPPLNHYLNTRSFFPSILLSPLPACSFDALGLPTALLPAYVVAMFVELDLAFFWSVPPACCILPACLPVCLAACLLSLFCNLMQLQVLWRRWCLQPAFNKPLPLSLNSLCVCRALPSAAAPTLRYWMSQREATGLALWMLPPCGALQRRQARARLPHAACRLPLAGGRCF